MRGEDYDVNNFLAGIIDLDMDIEEEEEEESEVYLDDESFFEPYPTQEELESKTIEASSLVASPAMKKRLLDRKRKKSNMKCIYD